MFPDIMVPVATRVSAQPALEAALAFMRGRYSHLTVLRLVELPYPVGGAWSIGSDPGLLGMYEQLRCEGTQDVATMEDRLRQAGVSFEVALVECRELPVEDAAIVHALHADLVIVGGGKGVVDIGYGLVVAVMLKSGRPVMFVPAGVPPPLPPTRIVLAWKPTREAARAVHDAMALLQTAEHVEVVMVDMDELPLANRSSSEQLLDHLRRHGVQARAVHVDAQGASVGATLQSHAERVDAQLIVTGWYGHSRLREWVLGGVTRELLLLPGVPVLFSH